MPPSTASRVARQFHLAGLKGISDETLEMHFRLYEGYVKALNEVEEKLASLEDSRSTGTPEHFGLVRRREFEQGGMTLHELYFDNLERQGGEPIDHGAFASLVGTSFDDIAAWRRDFLDVAATRGVGWVMTAFDLAARRVVNRWLPMHEFARAEGLVPLLVMDLWEHAYLLDYKPPERARHVEAFFENVAWRMVERRAAASVDLPMPSPHAEVSR